MSVDPIALARQLINCPSVTPARGEVFDVLEAALSGVEWEVVWVDDDSGDGTADKVRDMIKGH